MRKNSKDEEFEDSLNYSSISEGETRSFTDELKEKIAKEEVKEKHLKETENIKENNKLLKRFIEKRSDNNYDEEEDNDEEEDDTDDDDYEGGGFSLGSFIGLAMVVIIGIVVINVVTETIDSLQIDSVEGYYSVEEVETTPENNATEINSMTSPFFSLFSGFHIILIILIMMGIISIFNTKIY